MIIVAFMVEQINYVIFTIKKQKNQENYLDNFQINLFILIKIMEPYVVRVVLNSLFNNIDITF